ncbi:hypothetical protein FLA_2616 [Filimonas lacunae]|nr:hypothetical protein FLA_2616 [Filimonas lacunae]
MCAHAGTAQPTTPIPRVLVSGMPVVGMPSPYVIAGCPFMIGTAPSPCVTAQWVTGATRVLANGVPVLLLDSQSVCVPNGTPLLIAATQTRVTAI